MSLNLEILSTTTIKRKKPWSKTYWIGKEKEQLVLLDSRRISYLQLHNGETKKNIGHLNRYLEDTIKLFFHDENILALLSSGDILIWNKDSDAIFLVKGLPTFPTTPKGKKDKKYSSHNGDKKRYDITVNNNLRNIAVVVDFNRIFMWCGEKPIFDKVITSPSGSKKAKELIGSWFTIPIDNEVPLPNVTDDKNGILTNSFNKNHPIIASPFQCVYSYAREDTLSVPILTINPTYHFQNNICVWKNYNYPLKDIHPECHSIQHSGALTAALSRDGLTLALAVNQLATQAAKLVFISVLNGSMVSTSLKNYSVGQSVTMRKKYLWISDISWSYDDCFIVCITKDGSVCVASQLGELLRISLIGCSLKLGPGFYPNLYPLVKPSSKETSEIPDDDESVSTTSGCPNFKQRFSVTSHPRVPLFLLSDGYLVTLIRLPHSHSEVIQTSLWFLQEIKVALKPFRQGRRKANKFIYESTPKKSVKASLEAADMKDSWKILSTIDLTVDRNSNVEEIAVKSTANEWESQQLRLAGSYVISLWGLLSSYNYSWTQPLHSLASKSVELIMEMVEISLLREISFSSRCSNILQTPFDSVTNFSKDLFEILGFDCVLFNMLPTSVSVLNKIVAILSTNNIHPERITSTTRFLLKMERLLLKFYNVNLSRSTEFYNQSNENENYLLDDFYSYGNFNHAPNYGNVDFREVTTFQRLKPAWFSLYKQAFSNYRKNNDDKNKDEWCQVLCLLQKEIQERGWDINVRNLTKMRKKLDPASQIYLTGHVERATEMWISELKNNKRSSNTSSRKLHRILYSLLSQYNIAAFTFVFGIVRGNFPQIKTNENISEDSKKFVLYSIMKQMDCKNITLLVQSFARIWLSYYNKKIISIYPVHRAHSILPENQVYKGLRSYPLISPFISDSLSRQKMDVATNPTLVLELLLLGGLWFESVAFLSSQTNNKNHFRLAFTLAAIWSKTNNLIWRARCSVFPTDLEPKKIILDQLKFLSSVSKQDSKLAEECSEELISDLLLPAAICGLDLTPVILENIVDELTRLIEKSTLLVPNETYLPAPPIYCPQQSIGYEEGDMPSEDTEDGFRHSVATLIERFFCVVQASFLGFPLMAWYFSFIEKLWAAAGWNSFGEMAFSNLQFTIVRYLDINSSSPDIANSIQWVTLEASEGGQKCLQCLRNLLSLIWMLNCRDELSIACRNMHRFILGDETKKEQNPSDYFTILDQVLYWSEKIWPFRRIISSPGTLENIVFNTSNEINFSRDLLSKIVSCFLNPESLTLSGQNQLSYSVPKWETYLSNSTKYELKTFNDYCSREIEKRKLLGERIGKQFKTKCPVLKIRQFEEYCYELEEEFLNIAEPVFHIGILKRLSHSSPSSQTSTPLLTTFAKQLKRVHFNSSTDSIKTLVNLERQSSHQKSLLEFIEEANTTSPQSVLSHETLNYLKTPSKRQSVLFRQPIGSFWSPSRRVVEKFHKLVTEVRSQNLKSKSRNVRKINGNVVSKWKSTANLIAEELNSGRLTNLNKSVSVSNLFSQSILRPTIGKDKGYANKIPDLVVELQMKTNEDESLLPFVTWILSWASNGLSNIHILPSHVLLALVLESRRKVRVNEGRLSLVKVKIERGIAETKKPISRSLSLRIPEKLPLTSVVKEGKETQTLEYFSISPKKRTEENRPKERDPVSINDIKLPQDFNANLPEKEIKTKTVTPKTFSLPQVYLECWNKTKESPKHESSLKPKEKLKTVSTIKTKNEDTLKPIFDRNSPQRHSIRWKKETIPQNNNTPSKNAPNEIHQTEEDFKTNIRMEMVKTAEEIRPGNPARNDYIEEKPTPARLIESVKKIATQELPQISDAPLIGPKKNGINLRSKVSRMKERKSSDDATSSAESDHSDSSESYKKKRNLTKKSVLHKIPLLKADEERGKVSPKRYYVISDVKISSPQRRGENRRNLSHPVKLLKIENSNENNKLISNEAIKKKIDPDEVRRFVVGKVKKEDEENMKFEKKKLLSVLKPIPSIEGSPVVNECDVKEKPRKQKSLGPKTAAKLANMGLKLSLDNIERPQTFDEIEGPPSLRKFERPQIENIKIDNPKPQTPSIVSPDSCAQLQYDVYERLRSAKEKSTNSTQTILLSKDVASSTDGSPSPKISHDIGLMTTPTEAEMENERIRVFQKVQTSSKQTSISDDFEAVIRVNDGIIPSPPDSSKRSLENYDEDTFNSNAESKSSEYLTSPQISFSTKLEGLQKRLESIDEFSQNLGQELRNSKKTILDAENLANFDVNLNPKGKSACIPEWRKKETNSFEHRKTIILSLIDKKYKKVLSNYETGSDLNDNPSESLTDPVDDSAIDSDEVELRKTFVRSRSIGIEDEHLIEPAKMKELYRIYGSRRIPDRVIQKIRSEYIAKRQSSL